MTTMKYPIVLIVAMLFTPACIFAQQSKTDSLVAAFKSKDFDEAVMGAKTALERKQKELIPVLIQLLESTEYAKLYYSNQLMYPGTKRLIFQNAKIIPYELDWISVRAGWLLEELTFKDFGFRSTATNDPSLAEIQLNNFIEKNPYVKTYTINWQNRQTATQIIQSRKMLAEQVAAWWEQNKTNWTRVMALKAALQSNNEFSIALALDFIKDYAPFKESCDNFYEEYYKEIWPQVVLLRHSSIKGIQKKLEDFSYLKGSPSN